VGALHRARAAHDRHLDHQQPAAEHFNYGLRAYYFALAALAWLLNGWLFMGSTAWVVFVLYWREFRSQALASIKRS
jgi:uncharacterized membrane protein